MANIKQVAEKAGLSVSCVSKYLNNPSSVLPSSKEKIELAIKDLNYIPSRTARSLRTNKHYTVKIILEEITNPFFAELFEKLRIKFDDVGYTCLLQNIHKPLSADVLQTVDGIIVGFANSNSLLRNIKQEAGDLPVIALHWEKLDKDIPSVWVNIREAMQLSANHLLDLGCKQIAYVGGPKTNEISLAKRQGANRALKNKNLKLLPKAEYFGDFNFQFGYDCAKDLAANFDFDGIICENDVIAAGVICGLYRQGISVPNDVRVVGFDNIPLAQMYIPAITSVATPIDEMCKLSCDMMLDMINKKDVNSHKLNSELIIRQS